MTECGGWFFEVRPTRNVVGYIAWCAKTNKLGDGPLDVAFNEEVHFAFGSTAQAALGELKREVFS